MKIINKSIFPFNTIVCALAIPAIIFVVFVLKWLPCSMCLLQQLCIFGVLVLSLFCWIYNKYRYITNSVHFAIILIICFGIYVAADQVILQYFTFGPLTDTTSCSNVVNPFLAQATKTITGTVKSCSELNETVAGLSLAVYSLVFFIFMLTVNTLSLFINLFKKK